jgi:hypothetical protein
VDGNALTLTRTHWHDVAGGKVLKLGDNPIGAAAAEVVEQVVAIPAWRSGIRLVCGASVRRAGACFDSPVRRKRRSVMLRRARTVAAVVATAAVGFLTWQLVKRRGVDLSGFRSAEGQRRYLQAYQEVLAQWPVPYEQLTLPTPFGTTHVIANGDPTARPLVLLHATGTSPTGWLLNVGPLSTRHRVFAVHIMGEAGMSQQTRVLRNRQDCVDWLASVLDGLGLDRVRLAGWSFGGWLTLAFVVAEPDRVDRTVLLAPFGSLAPYAPAVMLFLKLGPYLPMGPPGRLALRMMSPGYQIRERFARQFVLGGRYFRSANPLTRNSSRFGVPCCC